MRRPYPLVLSTVVVTLALPAMAAAQGAGLPSVELVSPGGPGTPTLTMPCPTFTWAPGKPVASYELAVFELSDSGQPQPAPLLHVSLNGRASAWMPPATTCLAADRRYGWYMREISRAGEKPGKWSPALSFGVIDSAPAIETAAESTDARSQAPDNANGSSGRNPNQEILDRHTAIEGQLTTLLNPPAVTRETCFELGAELEIGLDGEAKLRGAADGEAGVWAFGNGIKANLKAAGELKFGAGLKGAGALKRTWCADSLGSFGAAADANTATRLAADAPLSDQDLLARLSSIAGQLQLTEDRLTGAMDAIPAFTMGGGSAWGPLSANSSIATLADIMPLPATLRGTLRDPSQWVQTHVAVEFRRCT